jgi:surface carbohydrate biosynthesis protein
MRNAVTHIYLRSSQAARHALVKRAVYDVPARKRFSSASLANASRSFAWGPHELDALTAAYPEHADRLVATGSPRVDLWRPSFADAHGAVELEGTEGRRGFVLFASNFAPALEVTRFWARMRDKRQHHVGPEDPFEFARYDVVADRFRVLGAFVRTVRRVAMAHPDTLVVVRPHPVEARGALTDLIGPIPNVLVTRERSLTPWVRRAAVLVQCDSTSGYEAAVVGTPVVSLTPDGVLAGSVVNRLGRRADDVDAAAALVSEALALDDRGRSAWLPTDGRALLERRISGLDGPLAADRIVDEWDRIAVPGRPWDLGRIRGAQLRVRARHRIGTLRARLRSGSDGDPRGDAGPGPSTAARLASERSTDPFIGAHKFPPLSKAEVADVVEGLRRALDRFHDVRVEVIGPDLIAFGPLGRRTARDRG